MKWSLFGDSLLKWEEGSFKCRENEGKEGLSRFYRYVEGYKWGRKMRDVTGGPDETIAFPQV